MTNANAYSAVQAAYTEYRLVMSAYCDRTPPLWVNLPKMEREAWVAAVLVALSVSENDGKHVYNQG